MLRGIMWKYFPDLIDFIWNEPWSSSLTAWSAFFVNSLVYVPSFAHLSSEVICV